MFPRARFIHVVRDPYVVFPSTVHFWKTMYECYGLQRPDEFAVREQVFADFAHMHDRLEETRQLIGADRFYELRYERLVADPVVEMQALYDALELGDFSAVRPAIARYAERSKRYRTNEYEVDSATKREISRRWSDYFDKHGYEKFENSSSSK